MFYVGIWVFLVVMIAASIGVGYLGHPVAATVAIFAIATLKAFFVANYYMGLNWEPFYVASVLLVGLLVLIILYVGLVPDIQLYYGKP